MSKKSRTILFLFCNLLFFLLAPAIILYSQGYRVDFEHKKISKTGGFFFKVLPNQTEIYLDGKLSKKTDFFFGSALLENLLPKKYKVELKKDGYNSWEKNLEIKEKEVTEIKTVVLFPANLNFSILTSGIEKIWPSPDKKNIILVERENNAWSLKLYDLEKNLKSFLIAEKDISPQGAELLNLDFSIDSNTLSLTIKTEKTIKYFSLPLDRFPLKLKEESLPFILSESSITYQKINNDFYYLDKFGYMIKTDSSFSSKQKLNEKPFLIEPEAAYEIKIMKDSIFLEENRTLYRLNSETKSFEKLFDNSKDIKISPNGNKIVYFSDYEIWILYTKEEASKRKSGDKIFLMRLSEKINNLNWINSDYLFFNAGNKIKISEVDERDKLNVIDIAEFNNPEPFWSDNTKKLYILSEGNLYQSDKLVR